MEPIRLTVEAVVSAAFRDGYHFGALDVLDISHMHQYIVNP